MRQRTSMGASALLAVALGAALSLSPAMALAETAADQLPDSPEQQVAVLDVEAKDPVAPTWKRAGSWQMTAPGTLPPRAAPS